jgi:hypothetical protein
LLTNIEQYLRMPLDNLPLCCQECEASLGELNDFVIYKFAFSSGQIVLCRQCAERIGFYLWTDSLRPQS